jgi:hypothetical protein
MAGVDDARSTSDSWRTDLPTPTNPKQLHCHIHEYQITSRQLFCFSSLALTIRIHTMACTQHIQLKTPYFLCDDD